MKKILQKKIFVHILISLIILLIINILLVTNSGFFDNLSALEVIDNLKPFLTYELILLAPFIISLFFGYKLFLKKTKRVEVAIFSFFGSLSVPGIWYLATYDPAKAWESFFPSLLLGIYFFIFVINVFYIFLGRYK